VLYVSDSGAGRVLVYNGRDKSVHRLRNYVEELRLARSGGGVFSSGRRVGDDDIPYAEYMKQRRQRPDDSVGTTGQVLLTYYAGRHAYTLDTVRAGLRR